MSRRDYRAAVAALLLLAAFFVAVLLSNDVDPCGADCRAVFDGMPGVGRDG